MTRVITICLSIEWRQYEESNDDLYNKWRKYDVGNNDLYEHWMTTIWRQYDDLYDDINGDNILKIMTICLTIGWRQYDENNDDWITAVDHHNDNYDHHDDYFFQKPLSC